MRLAIALLLIALLCGCSFGRHARGINESLATPPNPNKPAPGRGFEMGSIGRSPLGSQFNAIEWESDRIEKDPNYKWYPSDRDGWYLKVIIYSFEF